MCLAFHFFVIQLSACATPEELPDNIRVRLVEDNRGHWGDEAIGFAVINEDDRVYAPRIVVLDTGSNVENEMISIGYNVIDSSNDILDASGHGTHVISQLVRLVGYSEVIPVKISECDDILLENLLRGLEKAISLQPDIISMSLGTATDHSEVAELIAQAVEQNIVVIAAAGSQGGYELLFPAGYDGVISVLARNINNIDIALNNRSSSKRSFSAPGANIAVEDERISGSSIAVPFVTAVVAEMIAVSGRGRLSIEEIQEVLSETALHPTRYSYGLVQFSAVFLNLTLLFISGCRTPGYEPNNIQPPRDVDISAYYFNPWNENFRRIQDDGYVSAFEGKSDTHDGVTLRVVAIVSDGLTTYVRIAVEGELPRGLVADGDEIPKLIDDDDDFLNFLNDSFAFELPGEVSLASNHILEATMSDDSGNAWTFRHQTMLGATGKPFYTLRPTLHDPSLYQNEDVLIFYNTEISGSVLLSLEIEIRGINNVFIINELEIQAAPVVERDFSEYNLFHNTAFADMQLLSARSTYLETIFTIKWTVRPGFSPMHQFFQELILLDWGDSSINASMFRPDDTRLEDEPIEIISNHVITVPIPLDKEITVNPIGMYEGVLFFIPAL